MQDLLKYKVSYTNQSAVTFNVYFHSDKQCKEWGISIDGKKIKRKTSEGHNKKCWTSQFHMTVYEHLPLQKWIS